MLASGSWTSAVRGADQERDLEDQGLRAAAIRQGKMILEPLILARFEGGAAGVSGDVAHRGAVAVAPPFWPSQLRHARSTREDGAWAAPHRACRQAM
jgi:hypothetical protein